MTMMRKLLLSAVSCFLLMETIFTQQSSDDETMELFFQEYCRVDNPSLDEQFEKVISCRAREALPGMQESFDKCWKSSMGSVGMPENAMAWKKLICGEKNFLRKKNLIMKCTMKQLTADEETVYNENVAKCVESNATDSTSVSE